MTWAELDEFMKEELGMNGVWRGRCYDRLMTALSGTATLSVYGFDDFLHTKKGYENYEEQGKGMCDVIKELYPHETAEKIKSCLGVR